MKGQTNKFILQNQLQRRLRSGMTDTEKMLWQKIKSRQVLGFKFRRQHPFLNYILDFVCLDAKLVIEVDGGQHAESTTDQDRDRDLQAAGLTVLRFWNNEVLTNIDGVMAVILRELESHPHPSPSEPIPILTFPLKGKGRSLFPPQGGSWKGGGEEEEVVRRISPPFEEDIVVKVSPKELL